MKTRRRFSAEFKAEVALEAKRGERTVSELAARRQLQRRNKALQRLVVFDTAKVRVLVQETESLNRIQKARKSLKI